MLFQTLSFFYFFIFVFVIFHFVLKKKDLKLWFLFVASLFFYGCYDYRFVPLLLFTSIFDFYMAKAIQNEHDLKKRKLFLFLSVASNLTVLSVFKYSQFFYDSSYQLFNFFAGSSEQAPRLNIFLPIGISFYTFQSLSYVIDIYRGQLSSQRHPLEFLTAVSFFPHLTAGPIVRASTLLRQFEHNVGILNGTEIRNGLLIFSVGFLKKGLGDVLSKNVDPFFSGVIQMNPLESWLAGLSFTAQVYADFSGYMDMAIGSALLLGFTLPESFNFPFMSRSPQEFWHRWNISLSLWFRDYLYISLGGNRSHQYLNVFITMLVSGLWHGASWNFIIWGAYYGVLTILTILVRKYFSPHFQSIPQRPLTAIKILLTFYLTVIGMIIFRTTSVAMLPGIMKSMHSLREIDFNFETFNWILFALVAMVFTHMLDYVRRFFQARPSKQESIIWIFIGVMFSMALTLNGTSHAFIYFQF